MPSVCQRRTYFLTGVERDECFVIVYRVRTNIAESDPIEKLSERHRFSVHQKGVSRELPAGVGSYSFPSQSIVVVCPPCGERRRYLPSEVFLGKPHGQVAKEMQKGGRDV